MSDNAFEGAVGRALRATGYWAYHAPDLQSGPAKPPDWLFGLGPVWGGIECKEVGDGSLRLSRLTASQRVGAHQLHEKGGQFWLFVRFGETREVRAWTYEDLAPMLARARAGLSPHEPSGIVIRSLPRGTGGGYDLSFLGGV